MAAPIRVADVVCHRSHSQAGHKFAHKAGRACKRLTALGHHRSQLPAPSSHQLVRVPTSYRPAPSWANSKSLRVHWGVFLMWFDIKKCKWAAARDLCTSHKRVRAVGWLWPKQLFQSVPNLPNWIKLWLKRNLLRFAPSELPTAVVITVTGTAHSRSE